MPYKFLKQLGVEIKKQVYKLSNWSEYNEALRKRGSIDTYIDPAIVFKWHEDRYYDGTGSTVDYSDFAILTCHEIRMVYKLPLRQTQGLINSIFRRSELPVSCPDYSTLSRRLATLGIKSPKYTKRDKPDDSIQAIAIDSTGLKIFGKDEWHQEKHKINPKRSWRKLHTAIDQDHYFRGCSLTDRFNHDDQQVEALLNQVDTPIDHFSGDGAYDESPVYDAITAHSPEVEIVVPPRKNALYHPEGALQRNRNILEIEGNGRMDWQRKRQYGRRNYSELGMQRYKRIIGQSMHARELSRQKQEEMIGCSVINKMTGLGMPQSYRTA